MAEVVSSEKLAELLRHPEDLEKILALKADFTRKKGVVDGQLKAGLKEQLEITQSGMGAIGDSQRIVNLIKEEMMNIDKLCAESQNMIRDFPNLSIVSTIHRNFSQVETMKGNVDGFEGRLNDLQLMLEEDETDLENQPNLINIHKGLTQLRDIRDEALEQAKQTSDDSLERDLEDYFRKLDDTVQLFDEHFGIACGNLIHFVNTDNRSIVVRLALVIEQEERNDEKVKAMLEAQKDHKELVSQFKSIKSGPKQLRGYKEKFLLCIETDGRNKFVESEEIFLEDSSKLDKGTRWFFNDLNAVKQGMAELMPKKWKIFKTYSDIYHKLMHDWLISLVDGDKCSSVHVLSIISYREKYYTKMQKLGWKQADLRPDLLDDREPELVREWRQLIVNSVNEWMGRMFTSDKAAFLERNDDALDKDVRGYFRTKTLSDMWRMLREQTQVAGDSGRQDVTEGVIDEMFRALKRRQTNWQKLVADEAERYTKPTTEADGLQSLQDWLVTIANDQISCIDDDEESGQPGFLTRFRRDFEPFVSPAFQDRSAAELESIGDGYVDLSTHCISSFITLIFAVDFRATIVEFFTPKWYTEFHMKRITSTFDDYIADYSEVLHASLLEIFLHELSDTLLVRYLSSVHNRGAKFRRAEPFTDKVGDDVRTAFDFFAKFPDLDFAAVKQQWKATHHMVRLLEADKAAVADAYEACKQDFWDVPLAWVESVLKARDDYERAMLAAVKTRAGAVYVDRGSETIMSKVK